MTVRVATSLTAACDALADPEADVLAGGTDFMVEVNHGLRRPRSVVAINRVPELAGWLHEGDRLWLGATATYTELGLPDVAALAPGLAQAARTVGSPQIRNAGTVGGNLGTASPAGDLLPVLVAQDAVVHLRSATTGRDLPITEFLTGVKQTALGPGELIVGVTVPVARGPQHYLKVGTRNAMVIAVASVALVVDTDADRVTVGLGSVGPTPLRVSATIAEATATDFPAQVAAVARPIDDHRSSAAYRRHAVSVLTARAVRRAFP
ncbi:MAG TPA: FAD binding domain-containing protein [Acidimicrobiales bacterium]